MSLKNLKEDEVFKPVKDYEDSYLISNYGTLYSLRNRKIMNITSLTKGYESVKIQKDNKQFRTSIHRLVATAFIPTDDYSKEVNHIDGDKTNNHVSNLEWVTCKENINHSLLNRLKITKNNPHDIEELCKFLCTEECKNYTYKDLSEKFNIDIENIEAIYNRRIWISISQKYPKFNRINFKTNKKTDKEIEEICKYIKGHENESYQSIGDRFGVNRTYISDLKKMKYRKNITEKYFK